MNMAGPPIMAAAAAAAPVLNPLEMFIGSLNSNPYFIGMMMLLLNLGGRFIGMEVSKEQEKFFQHPWVRRALLFTVLFVATRNIVVALIMTMFVLLFLSFLLNENSSLCLFKKCSSSGSAPAAAAITGALPSSQNVLSPAAGSYLQNALSPDEMEILRRLSDKQSRLAAIQATPESLEGKKHLETPEDIYMMNIMRLRS